MEGANICQTLVSYLDSAMKMHILGANLPNPNEGGSYASDRVKERSTQALVSFDRQLLEETLTYDLISAIRLSVSIARPTRNKLSP